MSKAFTREDDGAAATPLAVPHRAPLPTHQPNYVTPRGLAALRVEMTGLDAERARLAHGEPSEPDSRRSLEAIDARRRDLETRLATALVVEGAGDPADSAIVRFGARVHVRAATGVERRYHIVGVDEADVGAGRIAFVAPIARALLGHRIGETVVVRTPRGEEELEIVAVSSGASDPP